MIKDFSKRHTLLIKGVATLLLLFHHLFYKMKYFNECIVWNDDWAKTLNFIAKNSKVCVALFLVVSGYGLVKSANRSQKDVTFRFSVTHIFKILVPLWFIYVLFVPLGCFFDRTFVDLYGSAKSSWWYLLTDLTGITYLLGVYPKANETWWFFGEIIRLYMLFPIFYYSIKKNSTLTFIACYFLTTRCGFEWFLPFVVGMIIAEKNFFSVILQQRGIKKLLCLIINLVLFALFTHLRKTHGTDFDAFYAVSIIGVVLCIFNPDRLIGRLLCVFGEHSANIFMMHTFIYSKYFREYIFWFGYPLFIFIALACICLILSVGIEELKKLIRYKKLGELINRTIDCIFPKINSGIDKAMKALHSSNKESAEQQ